MLPAEKRIEMNCPSGKGMFEEVSWRSQPAAPTLMVLSQFIPGKICDADSKIGRQWNMRWGFVALCQNRETVSAEFPNSQFIGHVSFQRTGSDECLAPYGLQRMT
jgi:hypothetical protein